MKALYGDAPFLGFRILGILVEEMRTLIELDEGSVFKPSVDVQTMIVGTMNNFLDSSLQMICAAHSCPEAVQIARITCLKHLFSIGPLLSPDEDVLQTMLYSSAASVMLQYSIIEKRENLRRCATASTMMSDCDEDDDAGEVSTCESKLGNDKIQDFVPVASKVEQTTNSALEVLTTSFILA